MQDAMHMIIGSGPLGLAVLLELRLYQSEEPWVLIAEKHVATFGDIATPHAESVRRTLVSYREGYRR